MVLLKKIEIFGFKTFPLRNEIFLKEGANVIIGPNGSGKSNILDALVWALGETKISNLRGGKTEDIIFVGNSKRKPLASAEVSLVFSDDNGEEKRIFRKAFRDGESIFRLDSKRVRLKDITEEVYKLGIGDRKYFFIEQGMIGNIVTMGALEKRALIEEAAGISRYREKKKGAYRKLIEAENNLNVLNNILEEVKSELELWEKEFEKLKKYKTLKKDFRDVRKQIFLLKLNSLEKRKADIQKVLKSQWEQMETLRTLYKEGEKELSKLDSKFWQIEEQINLKKEEFYREKENLELKRKELLSTEEKLKTNRESFLKNKNWLENSDKLINELENKLKDIKESIETLESETETFRMQKEALEEKIESKKEELNLVKEEYNRIQSNLLDVISRKSDINNKIVYMEEFTKTSSNKIKKIEDEKKELLKEKEKILKEKEEKKGIKYTDFTDKIAELKKKRALFQEKIKSKEEEIKKIEFSLQKLIALENEYKKSLNSIEEERKSGIGNNLSIKKPLPEPLAFFLEELLSLSPYEGKFSEGNSYILKQKKEEDIYKEYIESPFSDYFPEVKKAKDLSNAIELWNKEKNNYITDDGFLITINGEIYKGKKKGLILYKELLDDILKKIEKEEKILNNLTKEHEELKSELDTLNNLIKEFESKQNSEIEKKRKNEGEIRILDTKLENLEKQISIITKEKETIEKELLTYKEQYNKLVNESKEISEEEEKIEEQKRIILEKITTIESEIAEIEEEYKILNNKYFESEKEYVSSKKEFEGLNERIKSEKNRIITLNEEIKILEKEKDELDKKINTLKNEILQQEKIVKAKRSELDEITEEGSKIKAKKSELEKSLKKLNRKLASLNNSVNDKEIERATIERDIINLEENIWNELTMTFEELKKVEITDNETSLLKKEEELKNALEELSEVRFEAESEYIKFKEKNDFYTRQKEDIENSIANIKEAIDKIDQESIKRFTNTLDKINFHFNEVFKILFGGGSAKVNLLDESDILNSGVELKVKPPGKKLKNIHLLSGGEKALASIAFLFSMFRFKPSPICVLDEVDAPLDEANISKLLNLIKEMKDTTQFLIVTHNPKTLEIADAIYGVTMNEPGVSLVYSIDVPEKYRES